MSAELWATIYVDASYHPEEGAFWSAEAYALNDRLESAGPSHPQISDSNQAELYAITKAAQLTLNKWPELTGLLIKSDSRNALKAARYNAPPARNPKMLKLQIILKKVLEHRKIRVQWVPGHAKGDHTEARLNRSVDKQAKLARKTHTAHRKRNENN